MADTSKRKARRQSQGATQPERNRRNASIAQGNEVAGLLYNLARAYRKFGTDFQNVENFNQSDADYTNSAHTVYNEIELAIKNLEGRLATMSYTVTFSSNTYTFTAETDTISEVVTSVAPEQEYQDKTVALSPISLFNGFYTSFIAPATNTGSATISVQLYDRTFASKTLKKYENGVIVNLKAGDIVEKRLYCITIISGEAVLFGITPVATTTSIGNIFIPQQVKLSYSTTTTLNYSAGNFAFDDGSGSAIISEGTYNMATVGLNGRDSATAIATNTTYHLFQIYNPTTNISGVISSLSLTTPTLPSGFTKKKHIFSFITDGNSLIRPMIIYNRGAFIEVEYINIVALPVVNITVAGVIINPAVPVGFNVETWLSFRRSNVGETVLGIAFSNPNVTSTALNGLAAWFGGVGGVNYDWGGWAIANTNTNGELRASMTKQTNAVEIYTIKYRLYI
jgi:hypothetical protein